MGFNPVTGDYSRGAAGLWIEDGEIAFPVEEITIAGNFGEMLARRSTRSAAICSGWRASRRRRVRIARMTVAGE